MQTGNDSLVGLLQKYAVEEANFPVFTFLVDGEKAEQALTYADFDRKARLAAAFMQAQGLEGERVLLLFPQGLDYLIALFACFYAKVIAVPAYPPRNNRNMQRLQAIINNCEAKAILADQQGVEQLVKSKRDFSNFQLLALEDLLAAAYDYKASKIEGDDIAYLQYTSGSTGNPKGVIIRHANMIHNIGGLEETLHPFKVRDCTYITWAPMYHDMGLMSMMTVFRNAGKCYFMSPVHFIQKPARWLQAISKYGGHYSLAPNFAFDYCMERVLDEEMEGVDLSNWLAVTNGSEKVRLDTLIRFHDRFKKWGFKFKTFCPAYGMAEATLIVSTINAYESPVVLKKGETEEKILSSEGQLARIADAHNYQVGTGKLVTGAKVLIIDPELLNECLEGQEGEIWVSNPGSIASGYWNNEAATQHTFHNERDGVNYMRTGDLGFMKEGQLYISGRIKNMIIIRGRNYYPQDIEYVVQESHEALEMNGGAAFALDDGHEEQLVIVQELKRQYLRTVDKDSVFDAIRTAISQEFDIVPSRIVLLRPMNLPKTSSGKIQHYQTREKLINGGLKIVSEWDGAASNVESKESSEETVEELQINKESITKWLVEQLALKTKLKVEDIDTNASVRDYPLESIDAIFLADELSKWLKIKITAESFWALPTINDLAEFLEQKYRQHNQ
jgi:acyl-CoA synthetase (AMP-forming)/AMP-acid ligase II/acyl carrier protein